MSKINPLISAVEKYYILKGYKKNIFSTSSTSQLYKTFVKNRYNFNVSISSNKWGDSIMIDYQLSTLLPANNLSYSYSSESFFTFLHNVKFKYTSAPKFYVFSNSININKFREEVENGNEEALVRYIVSELEIHEQSLLDHLLLSTNKEVTDKKSDIINELWLTNRNKTVNINSFFKSNIAPSINANNLDNFTGFIEKYCKKANNKFDSKTFGNSEDIYRFISLTFGPVFNNGLLVNKKSNNLDLSEEQQLHFKIINAAELCLLIYLNGRLGNLKDGT